MTCSFVWAKSGFEVSETSKVLCPLEQFYKDSIATGIKVGEDLRGQVRQAIETLGNGFLAASPDLIRRLQRDDALCQEFYGEILRVVYRVLFLLFAEQRGMMPGRDSLYAETYAIAALRGRAEGDIPREDDFTDLWEGLKVTFDMVRRGAPGLGVFGYDGMLFAEHQTPLLNGRGPCGERSRTMRNSDLLHAIRDLTLIQREGVLQRISYADLGVEELGSIYESLLDFTPRVTTETEDVDGREIPPHTFFLDPRGSERKTTGSYYTHHSLVNELLKSALLPVARDRLAQAGLPVIAEDAIGEATAGLLTDYAGLTDAQRQAGEEAILSLKVCDPAVGSGHFVVKANDVLGAELARLRTGDEYPTEAQIQAAKRDVLAHCIYAVDVNPMAVELCKVSLWINASVRDRPLSFLDHHIKCGDSLIGATPELLAGGVPYQAFDQKLVGNDRQLTNAIRKRNRQEEKGQLPLRWRVTVIETPEDLERWRRLNQLAEREPLVARERYAEYHADDAYRRHKLEADAWTAAFFWPITAGIGWVPTQGEFVRLQVEGPEAVPSEGIQQIERLADRYRFFHWHLEFPDVFEAAGLAERSSAGFDVIVGNVPWERIKLQEKEFFADKSPEIANARTAAARRKLIKKLPRTDPGLHVAYTSALRESEAISHFLRQSGRYPLSAVGDINTYQVFAGLVRQIVGPQGRVGIIVPSGIATDYYNQDYFSTIVEQQELISFYDFENRKGLFPGTHRSYKFCLLTLSRSEEPEAEFAFFLHATDDLADPERRFGLSREEVALMNPNTGTVPVFRTRRDAELTKNLYRAAPVLVNEAAEQNLWGVSLGTMFHSGGASGLFCSYDELTEQGFETTGANCLERGGSRYLPLYEGKMFMQYDHRAARVRVEAKNIKRAALAEMSSPDQKKDPDYYPMPRFWVDRKHVQETVTGKRDYFVAFKKVTSPTNERTLLATVLPPVAANDSIHFVFFSKQISAQERAAFLTNLNAVVLDFAARQKLGGVNFNFWVFEQLPVLPPDRYTPKLLDFIVPRVVELTYTAWDLQPFAREVLDEVGEETWARWFASDHLGAPAPVHTSQPPDWAPGTTPPPFVWNEERRACLRAELDALYGHLYGLTREELAYILDTFPIVKRKDEAEYGEYRTKRMILEKYEEVGPLID
jgi:hypothetical protein